MPNFDAADNRFDLTGRRVAIIAHVLKYAEANDLLTFLQDSGADETMFVGLPLSFVKGRPGPKATFFRGRTAAWEQALPNRRLPGPVQYLTDILLTLFWFFRARRRWDLIVACDNLNTVAALILRTMGLAHRVVYYTIDFVPHRFDNKRMNDAYHWLDKFGLEHADLTWNVSDGIARGREEVRGLRRSDYGKQITVPIGSWIGSFPRVSFDQIEKHSIVYSGGLLPHQGVQLVLDALPAVVSKVPDLKFYITGMGPMREELEEQANRLGVSKHVKFIGYIESHEELRTLLARCAVGVAMYSSELDIWSRFAEPAKIKLYLAAGLPVVTTSVTYIAEDLERRRAGRVIPWTAEDVGEAVCDLLTDEKQLEELRGNALAFGSEFDWPVIFSQALSDPRLGLSR